MDATEEPSSQIVNGRLPKLNMRNWSTEFREAFLDYSLNYPDSAVILHTGVDNGLDGDTREPHPDQMELIEDPDNPGTMIEGDHPRYPNFGNQLGFAKFQRDEKRWEKRTIAKMKVISMLLGHMEREIRDKVEATQGFQQARITANLLAVWRITEQVVQGVGAISIYALTSRFMRMKQKGPEDWAHYVKEWRATVTDLLRLGNHQQVLEAIFNTHLVLTVDQTQFKEKLTPIYGAEQWPDYNQLMNELNIYANNRERLERIEQEAKAEANNNQAYKTTTNNEGCWNCGSYDHIRANCPLPPKRTNNKPVTRNANKYENQQSYKGSNNNNYYKRYENEGTTNRRPPPSTKQMSAGNKPRNNMSSIPRKPIRNLQRNPKDKPSNKTLNRKRVIKRAIGYLAEQVGEDEDFDEEEDLNDNHANSLYYFEDNDEDYEYEEQDDDIEEEEEDAEEHYLITNIVEEDDMETPLDTIEVYKTNIKKKMVSTDDPSTIEFILDTGCRKHNICNRSDYMENLQTTGIKIKGINGIPIPAAMIGTLPIIGNTLYVPEADANLISVRQVLSLHHGHIIADHDNFYIKDPNGKTVLRGRMKSKDGFWTCTMKDLLEVNKAYSATEDANVGDGS
eukprot:scaffold4684_cov156-Ochromonas_danica.AAC.1